MRTIVVLGMHRSATSMLARSMHKSEEVWMGDRLMLGLPDNPKGHYEQLPIVWLNNEILEAAGGSWDNPPNRLDILKLRGKFDDRMRQELERLEDGSEFDSIGFKDPRTCLTIELWEPFLKNPQYVCSFKNPIDIATSLNKRDGMPIEKGILLCEEYNNRVKDFINSRY
jgi:hypothetical protein